MKIIYAIPGIGTTKELFQNISVAGYALKVLEWPTSKKEFTLSDYAAEFIKQLDTSEPVNLMGVSFGGMICSELADKIAVNKVVLISSCKNRSEFPFFLKLLKVIPIHKLVPDRWLRSLSKNSRHIIGFEKELQPVFSKMVESMPDGYFYNCVNYIINWNKIKHNPTIISIHGSRDRLLTYKTSKREHILNGGSHAIVFNRAEEINKLLNTIFNGL